MIVYSVLVMFPFGRGELAAIDGESLDFSQLEEFINDDNDDNMYFQDALVSSSDVKTVDVTFNRDVAGICPNKGYSLTNLRACNHPHNLPDSPPDSGSEPPFSPPNEDAKRKYPLPLDLLERHGSCLPPFGYVVPNSHLPSPVHSTHSTSMPVLAPNFATPCIPPLYPGREEFLCDVVTSSKKRKLSESSRLAKGHQNDVRVKVESSVPSPEPVVPSSDRNYNFDLSSTDALFVDSGLQCIRFQPFQPNTWVQMLDKDMNEMSPPLFRVEADKGFNYSNADESFVCQKKNHFQVTVHVQPGPRLPKFVVAPPGGHIPVCRFALHFHGVKVESPTQTIKVEQSQSDRSKRPFHPVPVDLSSECVMKTTVGRLHFSETTSNNMRKKGKPNPDQRYFYLVVALVADDQHTVMAHASEKIIVRASNPGQFENDMELSWQKGHTIDSIFHNGRVGINTDRPEESLVVHGNIKVTGHILQPSDIRAKYDLQELNPREQLRNVAQLRVVRWRYLPEFGVGEDGGAGVIAQEVRSVLPEAVREAGDFQMKDGRLLDKLLVVDKERIFMENVGAVKELCKVTDNLENRIDELERINKKLNTLSRGSKRHRSRTSSWSNHFIQLSIIVLVIIMAGCLVALATLYLLQMSPEFNSGFVIQMKRTTLNHSTHKPIPSTSVSSGSSIEGSLYGSECLPEECSVYCCDDHFSIHKRNDMKSDSEEKPPLLTQGLSFRKRRMVESHDTAIQESHFELELLELNITLIPELCSEQKSEAGGALYIHCTIYISRHFQHHNITLQFKTDKTNAWMEYCGGSYLSCPREAEKAHFTNKVRKKETLPKIRSWHLPVGSFFTSRYRFRRASASNQQVCFNGDRVFTEYILTFQRRCDK